MGGKYIPVYERALHSLFYNDKHGGVVSTWIQCKRIKKRVEETLDLMGIIYTSGTHTVRIVTQEWKDKHDQSIHS